MTTIMYAADQNMSHTDCEAQMFAEMRAEWRRQRASMPSGDEESEDDESIDDEQWYYEKMVKWGEPVTVTNNTNEIRAILEEYSTKIREPEQPEPVEYIVIPNYDENNNIIEDEDPVYFVDDLEANLAANSYGLEGHYKHDFDTWRANYNWFGRSFQEWIQEKQDYERELFREMRESWEDDRTDDGGRYCC